MKFTRRNFIKNSFLLGSSLLLSPLSLHAIPPKKEPWIPAYEKLEKEGKLAQRVKQAYAMFENCQLCPRRCGVNRKKGEKGFCRAPMKLVIFSASPHFGEEVSLVGQNGSGTIFFSNCNLRCIFCQNWPISHEGRGKECQDEELADMMIKLQKIGCHNINLVTPTHVMPNRVAGTEKFVKWVAEALPKSTYVNIMPQYRVEYKAYEYPEIARGITVQEFLEAMDWAKKYGLTNLDPNSVAVRDFYLQRESDQVPFKGA
jgi:uncharacterized Fe-S radical SAM superfamily protein PflX